MICSACGTEAVADTVTCPSCGSDLQDSLRTALSDSVPLPLRCPAVTGVAFDGWLLKVGANFGPRYRIISLLGMGGMGAVTGADLELNMPVALKSSVTVRGHALTDPGRSRWRGLVLTRSLTRM
jgi:hypothetical protein